WWCRPCVRAWRARPKRRLNESAMHLPRRSIATWSARPRKRASWLMNNEGRSPAERRSCRLSDPRRVSTGADGQSRRPRPTKPSPRTVSTEFADRLDAYASGLRQRPATVAARLLEDALERAVRGQQEHEPRSAELTEARRHIEELS